MTIAEKMAEEQSIRLSWFVEKAGGEVDAIILRKGLLELITIVAEWGLADEGRWWEEEA